jgi:hypothetical protein
VIVQIAVHRPREHVHRNRIFARLRPCGHEAVGGLDADVLMGDVRPAPCVRVVQVKVDRLKVFDQALQRR